MDNHNNVNEFKKDFNSDRIKVVDSYLGSGKTQWSIDYINSLDDDVKIVYITPFLSECDRIIAGCNRKFTQPDVRIGRGRKMDHLIRLVIDGADIVSTHALFSNIDDELINALKSNNYILFLDETMGVVETLDLYEGDKMDGRVRESIIRDDVLYLKELGVIKINEDFSVAWVGDELGKYIQFKKLADRGLLYFVNDSLLIWSFPIEVFREGIFSEIYILTYLFDYQIQSLYYNFFDLKYSIYHVEKVGGEYGLIPTKDNSHDLAWKEKVRDLVDVVDDDKLNKIGCFYYNARNRIIKSSLSKTWFDNNPKLIDVLGNNIVNFFRHHTSSRSSDRLWTCFKSDIEKIKRKNLSKLQWLEITSRATNDYGNRNILAYCINRYPNPFFEHFFSRRNIKIDRDKYAVSEMLQWIWRSAIRNGENIIIYIPSERMRTLFKKWLYNKI